MADIYSDFKTPQGRPQLENDYWQRQKQNEKADLGNLFDDLIKTNFDVENLKGLSVFNAKQK